MNVLRSFDGDEQRSLPSLPESDSHTRAKNYIKSLIDVPQQDPIPPSVPPASIHPEVRQRDELPANVMSSLDPNAPLYKTANTQSLSSDFTKFLLKKDLLLTRLTSFNNKPETYASWKKSFKKIMEELGVTPVQGTDLLVKWLGKETHRSVHNP